MATDMVMVSPQSASNYRAIGPEASGGPSGNLIFQADVTEREEHHNELVITEHPVENTGGVGAVADHAYRRPQELHIRISYSNAGRDQNFIQSIYADLRRMQTDRWPMDVYTGKVAYSNMLIAGIIADTDQTTEYVLRADIHFREVILVNTQTSSVSTDPSAQTDPASTMPTSDQGSKQPVGGFNTLRSGPGPTEIPSGGVLATGLSPPSGAINNPPSLTGADLNANFSPTPQVIPTDNPSLLGGLI